MAMPSQTQSMPRVTVSISGGVADVRLNRADKLDALELPMLRALVERPGGAAMTAADVRLAWVGLLDLGGDRLPGVMAPPAGEEGSE